MIKMSATKSLIFNSLGNSLHKIFQNLPVKNESNLQYHARSTEKKLEQFFLYIMKLKPNNYETDFQNIYARFTFRICIMQ